MCLLLGVSNVTTAYNRTATWACHRIQWERRSNGPGGKESTAGLCKEIPHLTVRRQQQAAYSDEEGGRGEHRRGGRLMKPREEVSLWARGPPPLGQLHSLVWALLISVCTVCPKTCWIFRGKKNSLCVQWSLTDKLNFFHQIRTNQWYLLFKIWDQGFLLSPISSIKSEISITKPADDEYVITCGINISNIMQLKQIKSLF